MLPLLMNMKKEFLSLPLPFTHHCTDWVSEEHHFTMCGAPQFYSATSQSSGPADKVSLH